MKCFAGFPHRYLYFIYILGFPVSSLGVSRPFYGRNVQSVYHLYLLITFLIAWPLTCQCHPFCSPLLHDCHFLSLDTSNITVSLYVHVSFTIRLQQLKKECATFSIHWCWFFFICFSNRMATVTEAVIARRQVFNRNSKFPKISCIWWCHYQ